MQFINSKLSFAEFEKEYRNAYDHKQMRGVNFRNANGDINQSSLGYQYVIDTMTFIRKKIVEQKFYEIEFGKILPVAVGEGAFYQNITTNMVINAAGEFTQGDINQGSGNARLASVDTGVSPVTRIIKNWAAGTSFNIIEVEQALLAGNWDVVESRHRARKKMWDLGLQRIAFLGHPNDSRVVGLLNQGEVNVNTTLIAESISDMDTTEFAALVKGLIAAYVSNSNSTAMPTHFAMPLSDYVGLGVPVSPTYPFITKLTYLKDAFKQIVPGGIEVVPLAYCDEANNEGVADLDGKNRYVLYRNDQDSILMDIPVDLTVTQPNTVNNFQFEDAAYGQYSGVQVFRPLELLYFDWASGG